MTSIMYIECVCDDWILLTLLSLTSSLSPMGTGHEDEK